MFRKAPTSRLATVLLPSLSRFVRTSLGEETIASAVRASKGLLTKNWGLTTHRASGKEYTRSPESVSTLILLSSLDFIDITEVLKGISVIWFVPVVDLTSTCCGTVQFSLCRN